MAAMQKAMEEHSTVTEESTQAHPTNPTPTPAIAPVTSNAPVHQATASKTYNALTQQSLHYEQRYLHYKQQYTELKQKYLQHKQKLPDVLMCVTAILVPVITNLGTDLYHNHNIDRASFLASANVLHAKYLQDNSEYNNKV